MRPNSKQHLSHGKRDHRRDLARRRDPPSTAISVPSAGALKLGVLNVSTSTLVLNFDVTSQDVALLVNGLHFNHIYASKEACESALSLRASKPTPGSSDQQGMFPPDLELPKTEQIIDWINKNKYSGTQQPFSEFVTVFERAGNSEAATELKIRAANAALTSSLCNLLPSSLRAPWGLCPLNETSEEEVWDAVHWVEKMFVALFDFSLWILADHGYKPQRVGWFVLITLAIFLLIFLRVLRIVGYSIETNPDKIKPIGFIFLFDRLLPAYRLREENYRIAHYFVLSGTQDESQTKTIRSFGRDLSVVEATEDDHAKAERYLDVLKLLGLVFTIFIIAAVGRLVH